MSRSKMRKSKFCVVMQDSKKELEAVEFIRERGGYLKYDFTWPALNYIVVDLPGILRSLKLDIPFDEPRRARTTENMIRLYEYMRGQDGRMNYLKRGGPRVIPFDMLKAATKTTLDWPYLEGSISNIPTTYFERFAKERNERIEPTVRFKTFGHPSFTVKHPKDAVLPKSALKKRKRVTEEDNDDEGQKKRKVEMREGETAG